jgi:hypothetical protein
MGGGGMGGMDGGGMGGGGMGGGGMGMGGGGMGMGMGMGGGVTAEMNAGPVALIECTGCGRKVCTVVLLCV